MIGPDTFSSSGDDYDYDHDVNEDADANADADADASNGPATSIVTASEQQNEVLSCVSPDMADDRDSDRARAVLRVEDYTPRSETERCACPITFTHCWNITYLVDYVCWVDF
eukprot:COSAG02_NODE_498_length_21087_cov_33.272394_6_plen_112_part_00